MRAAELAGIAIGGQYQHRNSGTLQRGQHCFATADARTNNRNSMERKIRRLAEVAAHESEGWNGTLHLPAADHAARELGLIPDNQHAFAGGQHHVFFHGIMAGREMPILGMLHTGGFRRDSFFVHNIRSSII